MKAHNVLRLLVPALCVLAAIVATLLAPEPLGHQSAIAGWPPSRTLFLPVQIHLLRSPPEGPAYGAKLSARDAERVLAKANLVWRPAGIQFWCERIREGVHAPGRHYDEPRTGDALRALLPKGGRPYGRLHVCFLSNIFVLGIHFANDAILVNDAARLSDTIYGLHELVPVVLAHEFGHALGLGHVYTKQDRLMEQCGSGKTLTAREIARARAAARRLPFVETSAQMAERARIAARRGRLDDAEARWRALAVLDRGVHEAEYARRMLRAGRSALAPTPVKDAPKAQRTE